MADDNEHSLFSASGADGWMVCHGKIAMEAGRRTSSVYADEGTAAHTLAAKVLEQRLLGRRVVAGDFIGDVIMAGERKFEVTEDMAEHVDDYVDGFMIWTNQQGTQRFIEQRVHYHEFLGVDKQLAFGTADGIGLAFNQPEREYLGTVYPAGDELQIHDLKYGRGVRVDADGAQMKLYALGCLYEYGYMGDFKRITMVIHQPRLNHTDQCIMTVDELLAWAEQLPAKVQHVLRAQEDHGPLNPVHFAETYLRPGEKQCRFCDAKAICPALAAEVGEIVGDRRPVTAADFEDLTIDGPAEIRGYGSNFLAAAFAKAPLVEHWLSAVRADIERRVFAGEQVPDPDGGFLKLVPGKQGNRAWTDKKAVEERLKAARLKQDDMYDKKLISPTTAEKRLKENPRLWAALQAMITRSPGQPSVARASDKRAPLEIAPVADDFEDQDAVGGTATDPTSHPFRD